MTTRIAVYAGTFDPVTNGHLDIIERASKMFDVLYVTILGNPNKREMFSFKSSIIFYVSYLVQRVLIQYCRHIFQCIVYV